MYRRAMETSPKRQQLYFGLARLYSSFGQHEKALDVLQEALAFDENIGEAWWYVGLMQMFDLNQPEEGAKAILRAVDASSPYELRSVREALIVAEAAFANNDTERLRSVLGALPQLPGGSVDLYLNIARVFERAGMIEDRNNILNAIQQADPSVGPLLEALRQGLVDTIDESIKMAAPAATSTSSSATSTVAGASVPNGPGPRR
jgi:tetratricopeptide (TPR) repeat protein